MNASTRIALFAFVLATLAGCGNKGPLVLPPPVSPPTEAATPPADGDVEPPADIAPPADTLDDTTIDAPIAPPVDDTPVDAGDGSEGGSGQDGGNG